MKEHLLDGLTTDLRYFTLEITNTGLARVVTHDIHERGIRNLQLVVPQTIVLHLLRHEVPSPDVHLLVFRVTGQTNDFHSVQQRSRDIQAVGGTYKYRFRQVEIDL